MKMLWGGGWRLAFQSGPSSGANAAKGASNKVLGSAKAPARSSYLARLCRFGRGG